MHKKEEISVKTDTSSLFLCEQRTKVLLARDLGDCRENV